MAAVEQMFELAVRAYGEGRFAQVAELFDRIVAVQPGHAGARNLMGIVAMHAGQFSLAVELVGQAVELGPEQPAFRVNLGNALMGAGRAVDAEASYRAAIERAPDLPEAMFGLGNALAKQNRPVDALAAYVRAGELRPAFVEALANQIGPLLQLDRAGEAVDVCRQALALRPRAVDLRMLLVQSLLGDHRPEEALRELAGCGDESPVALELKARGLASSGRLVEAVEAYGRLLAGSPERHDLRMALAALLAEQGDDEGAAGHYLAVAESTVAGYDHVFNAGNKLNALGRIEAAARAYERALELCPGLAPAWNNLGNMLRELGRLDDADAAYVQGLAIHPDSPELLSNRSLILKDTGRLAEAEDACRRSIASCPTLGGHSNLGLILFASGRLSEALDQFAMAARIDPSDADIIFHEAVVLLSMGRYAEGWPKYEARWGRRRALEPLRRFPVPQWAGQELAGRTILIHAEQGFGDTLQFIRYAPLLAARGARVVAEVQPALVRLIEGVAGIDRVVTRGQDLPPADYHCPLMSLPLGFGTTLETVPDRLPYLAPPLGLAEAWADRLPAFDGPRIGLVWAGDARKHDIESHLTDRRRSMSLAMMAPLLAVPGVQFVSLQVGEASGQATAWPAVVDLTGGVRDFADTAGLVANLDLVIAVDTSVAHLAAGMGKRVWLLSRADACWRWMRDRADSPWYPGLRLFRQERGGVWEPVIRRIAEELEQQL